MLGSVGNSVKGAAPTGLFIPKLNEFVVVPLPPLLNILLPPPPPPKAPTADPAIPNIIPAALGIASKVGGLGVNP
jgi:hypothetical protein